jgi:putative FmdB family regulatory protein
MPIYEYDCEACGHELEVIQKVVADPLSDCPACGKPALKRKISPVGFRLKGSGWYETDFKHGDKKKNLVREDTLSTDSGKSADNKADKGSQSETAATA